MLADTETVCLAQYSRQVPAVLPALNGVILTKQVRGMLTDLRAKPALLTPCLALTILTSKLWPFSVYLYLYLSLSLSLSQVIVYNVICKVNITH